MNAELKHGYRVITIFDRLTADAVADDEDEVARACADGRPTLELGALPTRT